MSSAAIRIFIGSGEQSLLERKVLIYSLRKHTRRELDIQVFNGTHNSIESDGQPPRLAPLPLHLKYRNLTEFSLYRYLVPELCSHQGRAIYLDSDMVCLADIGQLFDMPLGDYDFLVKPESRDQNNHTIWGSSVMLVDCERTRFDLEHIFKEIDQKLYTYVDFCWFTEKFLRYHPYSIGPLDPRWNAFDRANSDTNLIHYTDLNTQPWKYPAHPYGAIWFSYFREARRSGWITNEELDLTIRRGYARPNLRKGNNPRLKDKIVSRMRRRAAEASRRGMEF